MSLVPRRYRVVSNRPETADTVSLTLTPVDTPIMMPRPGQFTMLYAFGIGEIPISVSATAGHDLVQTIRAVGAVSKHLCECRPADVVGVRGPYGTDWGVPAPAGHDLVIIGGGIGLAPLRPVIRHTIAERDRYREVAVLIGARSPAEMLFPDEYDRWRAAGIDVRATVDRADTSWSGHVGVVTTVLDGVVTDAVRTTAVLCGPEVMMRLSARALIAAGVPAAQVRVSLERNMRCGDALCGHCQLGPLLICRDGPVIDFAHAEPLMTCKEL
jgi:anaerobic sulfite reductase subunit B